MRLRIKRKGPVSVAKHLEGLQFHYHNATMMQKNCPSKMLTKGWILSYGSSKIDLSSEANLEGCPWLWEKQFGQH